MDFNSLADLVEALRRETIGPPQRVPYEDHHVFEYINPVDQTAKTVAVLKLVRASQAVSAMNTLCAHGHLIDMLVVARCVFDCVNETYFLLETWPKTSVHVDQFVKRFFETTLSGHQSPKTPSVPSQKIHAAAMRAMTSGQSEEYLAAKKRLFATYSGFVHGNYATIMEAYYAPDDSFNLAAVPHIDERLKRIEHYERAAIDVLQAGWFIARAVNAPALRKAFAGLAEKSLAELDTGL